MNLSGTTAATLAMLLASLLLAVPVVTSVRPSHVEPPRGEVRAEHRTAPRARAGGGADARGVPAEDLQEPGGAARGA